MMRSTWLIVVGIAVFIVVAQKRESSTRQIVLGLSMVCVCLCLSASVADLMKYFEARVRIKSL